MSTHQFIMKYIRELNECKPAEVKNNPVPRSNVKKPRWIRLLENFAKIRVDGEQTVRAPSVLFVGMAMEITWVLQSLDAPA